MLSSADRSSARSTLAPQRPAGLELLPAQAVEHDEHHLAGIGDHGRHPGGQGHHRAAGDQRGDEVVDAGAAVVREHGMVAHDPEVHHPPSRRARSVLLDGSTSP